MTFNYKTICSCAFYLLKREENSMEPATTA